MPKQYKVYRDFSGGLNTKTNPKDIEDNELVEATGVLVDRKGLIRTNQPSFGAGDPKVGGVTDKNAFITPGSGLFAFKSDYSWSDTDDEIDARESEYIVIGDVSTDKVYFWGYEDQAGDHEYNDSTIDIGARDPCQFVFYYTGGALRISDAKFSENTTSTTTKWFGRIGPSKKLLGEGNVTSKWVSLDNTLSAPTVGFVATSLSGTAHTDSNTTSLIHTSEGGSTGSITNWSSGTGGLARATDASHGLSTGDVITVTGAGVYNGIRTVTVIDSNNFDLDDVIFGEASGGVGSWVKQKERNNFQGWDEEHDDAGTNPIAAANTASRWLIAYDVAGDDIYKLTTVAPATEDITTATNSNDWTSRSFEIYPFPGDGLLLEAYQSEGANDGGWESGEYEFGQTFIYEGNQESKIEKLNGSNVQIDSLQSLNITIHISGLNTDSDNASLISQRLIGGRVYIRKANTNNFWSLLVDIDYRVGGTGGGGGTRLSTIDTYDGFNTTRNCDGGGTSGFGFTNTNFRGFKSKQYSVKKMSIESYENLNGFSPSEYALTFGENAGHGYKCAVVAGERVFVANVLYMDPTHGISKTMGDALYYTPIGKYDTFPSSYKLEIAGNDGDEFTALSYSNGLLFAFKKNTLYLIDISNPNEAAWKLVSKLNGLGIYGQHSVVTTDLGICWASRSGVFVYTDNKPINLTDKKLSKSYYTDSFFNTENGSSIGWDSNANKLFIIDSPKEASKSLMYDFETGSWTNGWPFDTSPGWELPGGSNTRLTNMISFIGNEILTSADNRLLPHGGILVYGDPATGSSNNKDLFKMTFTTTSPSPFAITTKDDDFGAPNVFKKIYQVDIEYVTDETSDAIDVRYEIDGNDIANSSSTALVTNQALSGVAAFDNVNILSLTPSSPIKCRSFSLRIHSNGTSEVKMDIVSIGIRYRIIGTAPITTETA